jgi:hypothetical protein
VITLATITAASPGVRSNWPTGVISMPPCGLPRRRLGRIGTAQASAMTEAAKPAANRNWVGGTVASPPDQATIRGPRPWPMALATM